MSSSQSEPALIPDEVLRGFVEDVTPALVCEAGRILEIDPEESVGRHLMFISKAYARELLACRAALKDVLADFFESYRAAKSYRTNVSPTRWHEFTDAIRRDFLEFESVERANTCLPEHAGVKS